jgi:signal transduction histidine kinase
VRPRAAAAAPAARPVGGLTGRMVVASGLLALIIAAAFAILLIAIADLRETARLATDSQEVLAVANSLERLVIDLETGQRGYVATRDESFLEPWESARGAIPGVGRELDRLTEVPDQDRRAKQIVGAVASYLQDYSIPLVEAARRGEPSARRPAAAREGKRRVDAIRDRFNAFFAAEQRISTAREDRSDSATRRAIIAAIAGLGGSIILIFLYAGYLTRAIVRPIRRTAQMAGVLASGDLSTRMPATGVGEIGQLEGAFNDMAVSLERSNAELAELASEQAALRRVATLVAQRVLPDEIVSTVAEEIAQRLGAEITKVVRYEPDARATVVGGWSVPGIDIPIGTTLTVAGEGVAVEVQRTQRPARVERFAGPPGSLAACFAEQGIRSGVGSPIIVEGTLWGVAIAGTSNPDGLPMGSESRIAEFTELVAMAIANAESRAELAASRARVIAAADQTRRQIERDLHDGAQQRLVSLALRLRSAEAAVPPELGDAHSELARVGAELNGILEELREMSRGIHPAILSEGGLGPALRTLARRSAVPVELEVEAESRLPEPVEVTAYYVVSEALTNAAKHASASTVHVAVRALDGVIQLAVRDNGVGGADPRRGSGLVGLKDRVEASGGTMTVESRSGEGTSLVVELPLETDGAPASS